MIDIEEGAFNESANPSSREDLVTEDDMPAAKPMSFKEAFKLHRAAGDATFEWNGKKFTTDLAKPKAAPPLRDYTNDTPPPPARRGNRVPGLSTLTSGYGKNAKVYAKGGFVTHGKESKGKTKGTMR